MLKGKGKIDKEPIDLAPATVDAISDWFARMGESKSPALTGAQKVDRFYSAIIATQTHSFYYDDRGAIFNIAIKSVWRDRLASVIPL